MFIVKGIYHFGKKPLAFRNDYCRSCDAYVMSLQRRSFMFGHLFWIPILPLGIRRRWLCLKCGEPAHAAPGVHRAFKWFLVAFLAMAAWGGWLGPVPAEDAAVTWSLRIGLPLAALALAVSAIRQKPWPDLQEKLAQVIPSRTLECPFCRSPLMPQPEGARCLRCGIDRR